MEWFNTEFIRFSIHNGLAHTWTDPFFLWRNTISYKSRADIKYSVLVIVLFLMDCFAGWTCLPSGFDTHAHNLHICSLRCPALILLGFCFLFPSRDEGRDLHDSVII